MKGLTGNPWVERFGGLDSEEAIRALETPLLVLPDLRDLPPWEAQKVIVGHLEEIFVVTSQIVKILQRIVSHCRAGARRRYLSKQQFTERIYEGNEDRILRHGGRDLHNIPLVFIGRAGDGKSAIANAVTRLIPAAPSFVLNSAHPPLAMRGVQLLRVGDRKDSLRLLPNAGSHCGYWREGYAPDNAATVFAHCSYRDGMAGLVVDELQNSTRSRKAGAEAAGNLLRLCETGVPSIFIFNFSLYCKLRLLDHPIIDRLLADLLSLLPSSPKSEDWHRVVSVYIKALEEITEERPSERLSELLGDLVATSPRYLKSLLARAHVVARESGRYKFRYTDILAAYRSTGFTIYRELIEAQFDPRIAKLKISNRDDVFFPSGLLESSYQHSQQAHLSALQIDAVKGTLAVRSKPAGIKPPSGTAPRSPKGTISLEELGRNFAQFHGDG